MDLRVTVVGGTGFIGRRLVERLVACGARVRIVSRRAQGDHDSATQAEHVTGSLGEASTIARAVTASRPSSTSSAPPAIPLIGGGRTRFQPMHVDDVAEAMARMLDDPGTAGRTFELGGSEMVSFRELIERLCRAVGRRPWLVPSPSRSWKPARI
jgi:NADH dehydrogenase